MGKCPLNQERAIYFKKFDKNGPQVVDFQRKILKNLKEERTMKKFFKFLLLFLGIFSTFLLGFHCGKEKIKSRIPKFQDDSEA